MFYDTFTTERRSAETPPYQKKEGRNGPLEVLHEPNYADSAGVQRRIPCVATGSRLNCTRMVHAEKVDSSRCFFHKVHFTDQPGLTEADLPVERFQLTYAA